MHFFEISRCWCMAIIGAALQHIMSTCNTEDRMEPSYDDRLETILEEEFSHAKGTGSAKAHFNVNKCAQCI